MNEPISVKGSLSAVQHNLLSKLLGELKIEIISTIMWQGAGDWEIPERRLDHGFLLLCAEGGFEGMAGMPSRKKKLSAGSGMLIPPGIAHSAQSKTPAKNLAVHFHLLSPLGLPITDFFPGFFWGMAVGDGLAKNLETLTALAEDKSQVLSQWGESFLKTFLVGLIARGEDFQFNFPKVDPRLSAPLKKIQEAMKENPGIKTLAALAGLSEEQFRKIFRRDLGLSPKEYLIETKLAKAAELLVTTVQRVNEISRNLGFAYTHYFHARFKKRYGVPPNVFRQNRAV